MRTRAAIDRAFVQLLHRRAFGSIRISDITRKAGVGRATFYAHFQSKDDLLRSQLARIVLPMLQAPSRDPFLLDCRAFFEHVRTAPHLYNALMGDRERSGARVIRDVFENHLEAILTTSSHPIDRTIPLLLARRFITSTLLGVIAYTLQSGSQLSAGEMQRLFQQLVGSGLSHLHACDPLHGVNASASTATASPAAPSGRLSPGTPRISQ